MTQRPQVTKEGDILVLAPLWRDAEVVCNVLTEAGFHCRLCQDMSSVQQAITEGTGALLVAEEALGKGSRDLLLETLQGQPSWSDLPLTLLLAPGKNIVEIPANLQPLVSNHNVTVLQRPIPGTTLVSIMNAAIRARRRQYQLREQLHERKKHAALLEQRVEARTKRLQELTDQYQAARDLFFTLFQANPLPIAIVRLKDGYVLDANEALLRYFNTRRDYVVNRTMRDLEEFLPFTERARLFDHLRQHSSMKNLEVETVQAAGERKTALVSAEQITVEGVEATLVALADISDRKRAEQQVRELASQLTRAENEERHRISQILHDDLQQQLYGLQIQLSFLRDDAPEDALKEINAMDEMMSTAIKTVRDLSVDLSPPILHNEGLVQGIRWIASRMQERYSFQVKIEADGAFPVRDDAVRVLLFQILRELLFNAVKHAGVRSVKVRLAQEKQHYRIDVIDQGTGFDPQQVFREEGMASGCGLTSACQRLRLIGGRLEIESTPGQGTRATIYTPMSNNS